MAKPPLIFTFYIAGTIEKVWWGFISKEATQTGKGVSTALMTGRRSGNVGRVGVAIAALVLCMCSSWAGPASSHTAHAQVSRLVAEADSLASKRRYEDASTRYLAALESWPESLTVAKRALGSFWRAGRDDAAYVWGRRVISRESRSVDVLFDLGVTCGFLVDLACADSAFRRAISIDSTFVDGYCELGFIAQARGNMTEAIRWMEAAHAVAPQDEFAVSGLAQMLIPAGQPARAKALMIPRIAVDRASRAYGGRSMLTLYAWACLALRDTSGADSAFDEVLGRLRERERAGQTSYQLYRERAAIYAQRGPRAAAVAAMQDAFAHGWRLYGAWSLVDPMFASVARDPEVVALIEKMRSQVRGMRRRLGMQPDAE